MGFIKTILGLIIVAIIVVFGYWLFASYVSAPDAPAWAQINSNMPDPLRRFSCDQVKKRSSTSDSAPDSCKDYWN